MSAQTDARARVLEILRSTGDVGAPTPDAVDTIVRLGPTLAPDDALIAEAASRGMSVMDAQGAARKQRIVAALVSLADEWEADSRRREDTVREQRLSGKDCSVALRHQRLAHQHASALRALLSADDEKAGA